MRQRALLLLTIGVALLVRLTTWQRTFVNGRVYIDGPDGYYHLRRAWLAMQSWPHVLQVDPALNWPRGGLVSWPPLFDGLLATLALPFRSTHALEVIGALLPAVLGTIQIVVMYALIRRLRGERAALVAAVLITVVPGVVRYTMTGVLDHDPFFSLALLVALYGVAASSVVWVAIGLVCALLGWGGGLIAPVVLALIVLVTRNKEAARATAIGCAITTAVVLPFVLTSVWRQPTFEGLSILHAAVLIAALFVASLVARMRAFAIASGVVTLALLPFCAAPFIRGARYAAGDAPILAMVAEARPLLWLLGRFDLRPMLIRFGLLALVFVISAVVTLAKRRTFDRLFVVAWAAVFFTLALLHSRFSYDAAIALCAASGLAFDDWFASARSLAIACVIALLPVLPAYVSVSGFEPFNFYARPSTLRETEMDAICDALRTRHTRAGEGVLAPWSFGHWILWIAQKPVVLSPMLSVGQSDFTAAMQWEFLGDEKARQFLRSHRVGYVIVTPEPASVVATHARVAGLDAAVALRDYQTSVAVRLTFGSGAAGYREILRSRTSVPGPFGPTPLVRVYEVE